MPGSPPLAISTFEYLTLRRDAVAQRLIPEIERFVVEDRERGDPITRILLAYAAADLNVKAAREDLLVHVNAAHHRNSRIAERRDLASLSDVIGPADRCQTDRLELPMKR